MIPQPVAAEATSSERLETILDGALKQAESRLWSHLGPQGHWRGELSASALSTATAAFAIHMVTESRAGVAPAWRQLVGGGLDWLVEHANADGGWGDTVRSRSNPSTTLLAWAALQAAGEERHAPAIERAKTWLEQHLGDLEPMALKVAIENLYGDDRTFSIPILSLCALAGILGPPREAFRGVTALPFELAALPQSWFRYLGLPVVSYALPALIAVGQAQHRQLPTRNPMHRWLRDRMRGPTLRRLDAIQPASGGFLEAIPLTSFVTLSLVGAGEADHPVVDRSLSFLADAVRPDGSWPIDIDLATWVTTLSIQALSAGKRPAPALDAERRATLRRWLLDQQYRDVHPFTGAAPGAWAWTDLPGGVPDADDTPGALLALYHLGECDASVVAAAEAGISWLLDLQNRDGGLPTFCRGWGKLPFDRSSCDLTAHALRAFTVWRGEVSSDLRRRLDRGTLRALEFLRRQQRADGAWLPLWFGNEAAGEFVNPTYGTGRVLLALRALQQEQPEALRGPAERAEAWLLAAQNSDGSWGGDVGVDGSIEETAVAVEALAAKPAAARAALERGTEYLAARIQAGDLESPTPIGFYFANLWYYEQLYPITFAIAALRRARLALARESAG
ncbi:MAG: prenyltransferase/squalene oxidase repeat-containing protein [Acidobacteriota bacterium]